MLIRVPEASKLSNIPETTIREMIKTGKLKTHQEGNAEKLDKTEFLKSLPTVIAFFNQKGGVGKTTTSILFADYCEKNQIKTLIIDTDEQSNLSQTFFSYDELSKSPTLFDFFDKKSYSLNDIVKNVSEYIDVIPATIKMNSQTVYDTTLFQDYKDSFKSYFKKYQIVIIDCPPALNFFSRISVMLCNYLTIILQAEPFSYDGLTEVIKTIHRLTPLNQDFKDYYAVINSFKGIRTIIREEMRVRFKEELEKKLFDESIPEFIGFAERSIRKKSIFSMYNNENTKKLESIFDELMRRIYEERK